MDLASLVDILIQNGGLGIFAAYLIYEASRQRKQIETLTEVISGQSTDFGAQLERLRSENRVETEKLRDRYDTVITELQARESRQRETLAKEVADLSTKVSQLKNDLESGLLDIQAMKHKFDEIRLRDLARGIAQ